MDALVVIHQDPDSIEAAGTDALLWLRWIEIISDAITYNRTGLWRKFLLHLS